MLWLLRQFDGHEIAATCGSKPAGGRRAVISTRATREPIWGQSHYTVFVVYHTFPSGLVYSVQIWIWGLERDCRFKGFLNNHKIPVKTQHII